MYIDYHASDQKLLPAPPASFLGRQMSEVLPPRVAAAYAGAFARLTHEPGPVFLEYPLPMPDGEHSYEARIVPCRDNEVLAVVRDVTERKKSTQSLHEAQADLSRVSRLTALGEFAASLSHEIRQPLTGILLNAKTCLRWLGASSPDLTEVRDALSDVVEAGQRANEIIRRNRELFRAPHRAEGSCSISIASSMRSRCWQVAPAGRTRYADRFGDARRAGRLRRPRGAATGPLEFDRQQHRRDGKHRSERTTSSRCHRRSHLRRV